jgi:deleted-in-malignant-brain-tumors protein 1
MPLDATHSSLAIESVELEAELAALHREIAFMEKAIKDIEAENERLNSTKPSYAACVPEGETTDSASAKLLEALDGCSANTVEVNTKVKADILDAIANMAVPPPAVQLEIESGLFEDGNAGALRAKVGNTGTFGYVCDDYFDYNDYGADVACKSMGFNGGTYMDPGDKVASTFSIDDIQCNGDEDTLDTCSYTTVHNCWDSEVAGVWCYRGIVLKLEADNFHLGFRGNTGAVLARVGPTGDFGYICDDVFDQNNNAADVVCRSMGFSGGIYQDPGDRHMSVFAIDDVQCTGSEKTIDECKFIETHNCGDSEVAGVHCYNGVSLKIEGGSSSGALLAKVGRYGDWGYVCDDYFDWTNHGANIACKDMGYSGGTFMDPGHITGSTFALDDVQCQGHESKFDECPFSQVHNCGDSEPAGVSCY